MELQDKFHIDGMIYQQIKHSEEGINKVENKSEKILHVEIVRTWKERANSYNK